ncbi:MULTISPECIES: AMP-binding protein [unclassified Pseudomonas]|uniref:AMP-binding protein n=1 Tax=unclassified Pseudomonas TaxID=196821 RepID=UPI002B22DF6C|nr:MULTISPECIES: AMP-binding protein [unclassified Pseudomonas]MEB0040018.1 AMP-binding protein [Pseudomonas sp. MH10]MEB0119543.1 AMP-binding protein [Pseudomonas sp. CCI1.2]
MSLEREAFWLRLSSFANEQPQKTALWGDDLKLDYSALLAEIELRRQLLRDADAGVVALILDNGPNALIWDLAILFEGLTCIALPTFFSASQRLHCLEQSHADLVIAERAYDAELEAAQYEVSRQFWRRTFSSSRNMPPKTAKLTFTSGTTGAPKGVCLSADNLLTVARELYEASQPVRPVHHVTLLPLAILLENIGCYAALYAGASISLASQQTLGIQGASGVDTPRLLTYLNQRRPDSMILVPQLLLLMVTACEMGALDSTMLRFVAVGGARVSLELLLRAQAADIPIYEGYGLSECASVVALNRPAAHRVGSVGKPLPHVQVRLAEDGEVLIGSVPMLGYLGDTQPIPSWWPTGDLGEFDAQGYLYLKGRKKNQFVTSFGRNVNPEWVEAELTQGGQIAQAFVYGEAMAHNHALLWPYRAEITDLELGDAVAQANLTLPDYARVHSWTRLEQPFSTTNGLSTANGRPRRDAILNQYGHHFISSNPVEGLSS